VAGTPEEFAEHVVSLLSMSPQARRSRAALADLSGLHWGNTLSPLGKLLEAAARSKNTPEL
jgi:hypothetical protein